MNESQKRQPRGFTLIELMVVVGMISVMTALAMGMTTDWRRRNVFNTVAREIYNCLNIARATAIKKNRNIMVAFRDTPNFAVVFEDVDNDRVWDDGAEAAIYRFPADAGATDDWPAGARGILGTVDAHIVAINGNQAVMLFDSYGFHVDIAGEPLAGAVTIKDNLNGKEQFVDVTVAGALRIR